MRTEIAGPGYSSRTQRTLTLTGRLLAALHIDGPLLVSLIAVCCAGLVVLYSAAGEDVHIFLGQAARMGLGLGVLTLVAQVPPRIMRAAAPFLYGIGVLLLVAVARRRRRGDGRAALARPRLRALPAVGNHEDRGAARAARGTCTSGRCRPTSRRSSSSC